MQAVTPACTHLSACPGCPRFGDLGVPLDAQARLTALAARLGVLDFAFIPAREVRYRLRSRLAVRGRAGRPKIGLFEVGTHQVVDIPRCAVHHPSINAVVGDVKRVFTELRVPPYSDTAHAGLVRYLQLVVERSTGKVQLVVVVNTLESAPLAPLLERLQEALGEQLHSLFINRQCERTNAILGAAFERVAGPPCVEETIGGAQVFFPPGAFGQASPELFDAIVQRVHSWVPDGSHVTELYAGVGAIGLGLVSRSAAVRFNERSPDALSGLRLGLERLGPGALSKTRIDPGPAEAVVAGFDERSVVVVDPPRRGLDAALIEQLTQSQVQRLIYVSCGLDSFLRDAELLGHSYVCRGLFGYALFPFTHHVETVACFDKRS